MTPEKLAEELHKITGMSKKECAELASFILSTYKEDEVAERLSYLRILASKGE